MVAPGGHITALSRHNSKLARKHPEYHNHGMYFTMSGASQAAAVDDGGKLAYSVFQQGAGVINA